MATNTLTWPSDVQHGDYVSNMATKTNMQPIMAHSIRSPTWRAGVRHGDQNPKWRHAGQLDHVRPVVAMLDSWSPCGLLVAMLDSWSACWTFGCHVGLHFTLLACMSPCWTPDRRLDLHVVMSVLVAMLDSKPPCWTRSHHVGLVVTMLDFRWPCERIGRHDKARASAKLSWPKASWKLVGGPNVKAQTLRASSALIRRQCL